MGDLSALRFDIWQVLLLFGIFQAVFLAAVILWTPRKNQSEYLLVLLLAIIAINLTNYLLLHADLYRLAPHLVHLSLPAILLIGPVYFLYARSLLPGFSFRLKDYGHFVLFGLGVIFLTPFYFLDPAEKLDLINAQQTKTHLPLSLSINTFLVVQILQSMYYTYRVHRISKSAHKHVEVSTLLQKKKWLHKFNSGFAAFWFTDLLCLTWFIRVGEIRHEAFYLVMLVSAVFVSVLAFMGIRYNRYFSEVILNRRKRRYNTSTLNDEQLALVIAKLQRSMERKKLYLDPTLSLAQFATAVDLPRHQCSQVLNGGLGKNFYDFVNEYRFNEVRRRLEDKQDSHLTILAIAFESGFNNKNTFNKVFKKYAGMTPSQFLVDRHKVVR
ncbi:MAG: helix-turn-helix domain-containing protein [Saprospiraceae bacterium]|nr:helix-turn-helix domain-containing protein [Saprospiraceae bacterium]